VVHVLFLSLVVNFSSVIFLLLTLGLDLFSGAYLNKFTVSMVSSDRIAQCKGPVRLGALCLKMEI